MNPFTPRAKHGPEHILRGRIVEMLQHHGWYCKITHGNMFQSGVQDIICAHPQYGVRFIDVKVKGAYEFTNAQKLDWPEMDDAGWPIWILTGATDAEYAKLFQPPNWREYWKPRYDRERAEFLALTKGLNDATD